MEQKPKQKKSSNSVVYKCNSKHCKDNGFHDKDEMRTITLKLTVGRDCPLDFEDATVQVVTREVVPVARVGTNTQDQQMPRPVKKSVVPQGLIAQGLQMRPPKDA